MKTYLDFIAAVIENPALIQDFESAVPFDTVAHLKDWFIQRGYTVSDNHLQWLFHQQHALTASEAQVNY